MTIARLLLAFLLGMAAIALPTDAATRTPQEALPNRLIATPPNPAQQFGNAIAVAGDLLVVGAPNPGGPGAIYVFDFNGTSWNPAATIRPSDSADGDRFGTAVAIDGTRILAGAPGADSGSTRGAA
ncbi:MAG TPA: hypothetical protein PKC19_05720, partial [Roseiflexaceae bacterium]|nr:hypothetical protein [Roseiflexaceae bacterium]